MPEYDSEARSRAGGAPPLLPVHLAGLPLAQLRRRVPLDAVLWRGEPAGVGRPRGPVTARADSA